MEISLKNNEKTVKKIYLRPKNYIKNDKTIKNIKR